MAGARSSSGGVAICYVLPVLWMTSLLAVMGRIYGDAWKAEPTTTSGVAIPGRSLISMNALFKSLHFAIQAILFLISDIQSVRN